MNRETRIGMNEAVFRDVNERIQDVASTFDLQEPLDLICECGDAGCVERIRVSREEYEKIRSDPQLFAVAPGHGMDDAEKVEERQGAFDIVRKNEGAPAEIAENTDPRADS